MKKVVLFLALAVGLLASATMMAQNVLLHETFDTVELDQGGVLSLVNLPTGWTRIDADNDGNNWFIFGKNSGFDGGNCATSASWSAGRALTPDNYLITPKVEGARRVEFYANAQDATSPNALGDHFAVCASSTGTAASDFTVVYEDTPAAAPPSLMQIQKAPGTWRKYVVNLPAGTKYVAFRHYNCTNFFRINIDDVTIYDAAGTAGVTPQTNMNRYVKLNVVKDSAIKLDFWASVAGTSITIKSGSLDTTIIIDTAWHGAATYKAGDTIMKVYGNVARLACGKNGVKITAVDASHNANLTHLICSENQLTKLDVSGCEELTNLDCNSSNLTDIDISSCTNLKWLDCHGNPFTTPIIENIYCKLPDRLVTDSALIFTLKDASDPNGATVLATTKKNATDKNWKVQYFDGKTDIPATTGTHECYPTDMTRYIKLTVVKDSVIKLDFAADSTGTGVKVISGSITKNLPVGPKGLGIATGFIAGDSVMTVYGKITSFECGKNGANVTALDPSHNTEITSLSTFNDSIRTLDISKNTKLTLLDCQYNQLSTLDLSKDTALTLLGCSGNQRLTTLDVSKNTKLMLLWCFNGKLSNLDVSSCKKLEELRCYNNELTSLNINGCEKLAEVYCYDNKLTSLDLSNTTALAALDCSNNELTSLDVSKNTSLIQLWCTGNKLTNLDISKNTKLMILGIWGNKFSTATLDAIYCHIPDRTGQTRKGYILSLHETSPATEQNNVNATNAKNATDKNWRVVMYKNDNNVADITTTGNYNCNSTGIAEAITEQALTFYPNPVVDVLYLSATAHTIHIYNVYGTEVAHATDTDRIDVANLPAGVYTVKADGTVAKMVKR
ncbi:MAG: choice-of-anchor J domain-containing protein [Bacteroidota bacterium]